MIDHDHLHRRSAGFNPDAENRPPFCVYMAPAFKGKLDFGGALVLSAFTEATSNES
jgi:hypothetical protein